jgi:iron complex transport system permease protein
MMEVSYDSWLVARIVAAALIGTGLGVTGSMLQRYLNNDLADPYLLGVSGGAMLGSVGLGLLVPGVWLVSPLVILLVSLCGSFSFGSLLLLLIIWGRRRLFSGRAGLVLFGVAINGFCAALTMLLMSLEHPLYPRVDYGWLVGRIESYGTYETLLLATLIGVGVAIFCSIAGAVERAPYGEFWMRRAGKTPERVEFLLLVAVAIVVCTVTAYAGSIGFVGLMVPHIARMFCKSFRAEMVLSAGFGCLLLVGADLLAQFVLFPRVLPVGVLTSLTGAIGLALVLMKRASGGRVYG